MADERRVRPEDTESAGDSVAGRTPGRWLDRGTAERLLRGESPENVDATARDQAERLAETLAALSARPTPADIELPGEEAALAAFRKVRADRADDWVSPPVRGRHRATGAGPADAPLVRIGAPDPQAAGPRRRRSVHFGLAAALAAGVVGGAAIVAGTAVLAQSGDDDPDPGASVSAAVTPDRPLISPSPLSPEITPSPDGAPTGATGSRDTARGDTGAGSEGLGVRPDGDWSGAASACRDMRDGKNLDSSRKRSLEGAAGGPLRVWKYCKGVLSEGAAKAGPDGRKGTGRGAYEGHDENGNDNDDRSGRGDGDGRNGGQFTGPRGNLPSSNGDADGGTTTGTAATGTASDSPPASYRATMSPGTGPSPTYSTL